MGKKTFRVCQLSSLHIATDTRIFHKYAKTLSFDYEVSVVGHHPKAECRDGIRIYPFKTAKKRLLQLLLNWVLMSRKALMIKADIYHIHDPELLPCAILLHFLGKKVIIDVHENIAEDIFDKDWIRYKKLMYFLFDKVERFACKRMTVIVAEDSYVSRYRVFSPRLFVIHNYVDESVLAPYRSDVRNPLHLFYMGIILESRCISEILTAVYLLHQKGYAVHFHCVGQVYHRMKMRIESHPHHEAIKEFLHWYGRRDLMEGYALSMPCGIGLCLIKPMSNSVESMPTKIFEYMAVGLPIIASNFPLYNTLVEDEGVGVNVCPDNIPEIIGAIEGLIQDTDRLTEMGKKGIQVVSQKYQWQKEASLLKDIYQNELGRKG